MSRSLSIRFYAGNGICYWKSKYVSPGKDCEFVPNPKLELLDQLSEVVRFKHYSIRTEATYREWIIFNGRTI